MTDHLSGKELFISAGAIRKPLSIYVFTYYPLVLKEDPDYC